MSDNPLISVIIPTYNEANTLPSALLSISSDAIAVEILVVDCGSSDDTAKLAEEAGAVFLVSPLRQRAAQMNMGTRTAKGDILLFLHADTCLPAGALEKVAESMENPRVAGGAFCRRFVHPSFFLKFTCLLADWRLRLFGWSFGDQGIFVRKSLFQEIGGFPEIDLFEDLEFSRHLAESGKVIALSPPVLSSGRRFGRNPFRRTIQDLILTWKYLRKT